MPAAQPLYDLVLMLDTGAEDGRRAEILRSVTEAVRSGGEIVNEQDWGARALAYEIAHRKDAEYHLLQFHGTAELLAQLDRSLRITDEVVRYRIIKLAPGTPPPPEHRSEPRPAGAHAAPGGEAAVAEDAPRAAAEPAAAPEPAAAEPEDAPVADAEDAPVAVAATVEPDGSASGDDDAA